MAYDWGDEVCDHEECRAARDAAGRMLELAEEDDIFKMHTARLAGLLGQTPTQAKVGVSMILVRACENAAMDESVVRGAEQIARGGPPPPPNPRPGLGK